MQPADVLKQWSDLVSQFNSNQNNVFANLPQSFNLATVAQTIKTTMQALDDVQKANNTLLDNMLKKQLSSANLEVTATAVKEITELNTNTFQILTQLQLKALNSYAGVVSDYVKNLENVRTANDVAAAQGEMFSQLQEKVKDNTGQMIQTLTAIQASGKAWTEKMLDLASGSN